MTERSTMRGRHPDEPSHLGWWALGCDAVAVGVALAVVSASFPSPRCPAPSLTGRHLLLGAALVSALVGVGIGAVDRRRRPGPPTAVVVAAQAIGLCGVVLGVGVWLGIGGIGCGD